MRAFLVDAKNAFHMVNWVATLWNARVLWPWCSCFLFNTFVGFARLVLRGSDKCIFSREAITQGDPLSMLIYAVAQLPHVKSLKVNAADLVCGWLSLIGNIKEVRSWNDQSAEQGPVYQYFPESKKSCLIVRYPSISRWDQASLWWFGCAHKWMDITFLGVLLETARQWKILWGRRLQCG